MPVNFYKGENYNQETKIGSGYNLYSNTGLWSKEAYFNFYDKAYNSDLNFFLRILKQSKNNLNKLKIEWDNKKCITIVLCAKGYPGEYVKDKEIKNKQG